MMRATIFVEVGNPEGVRIAQEWLARWRNSLSYISENEGCGCCVDIWNVEGPPEAIDTLPRSVRGESEWAQGGA